VRDGDWKLIEFFEDIHRELANLRGVIGEANDRASRKPARLEATTAQLHDWQREIEAIIPRPNSHHLRPIQRRG